MEFQMSQSLWRGCSRRTSVRLPAASHTICSSRLWATSCERQKRPVETVVSYSEGAFNSVRAAASESVGGLECRHWPSVPSKGTHLPLPNTKMPSPRSNGSESSTRPSGRTEYLDASSIHENLRFNCGVVTSLNASQRRPEPGRSA